jgi:RNA polymerase sigma-70 factor (ECF subfamily)
LRLLCGLETPEIARAFLVPEPTMAQRVVRAKRKIRDNRMAYRIPSAAELPDRLPHVLAAIYLLYNEGYAATVGELMRADLTAEAVRLARLLVELMPDEGETLGLLGLLLLTEARGPARTDAVGNLVRLADQDRMRWDRARIDEGHALVRRCLRRNHPGPYQLQAAIAAVHTDAATAAGTDWSQIVALYDQLYACQPTSIVALNRAIAVAELHGPRAGLDALVGLDLDSYHLFHATRAEYLAQVGEQADARAAYDRALARVTNEAERRHLTERRDLVARPYRRS